MRNRYLDVILTVIACELLWLALNGRPVPVAAQVDATPVIITGIRIDPHDEQSVLPVSVPGTVTILPAGPVKVETDRPLLVESVPYTPGKRPG